MKKKKAAIAHLYQTDKQADKMMQQKNRAGSMKSSALGGMSEEERLAQEFAKIDTNGDGRVDRQEMDAFLAQSGIDDDHRSQIVAELFEKLDGDQDGRIDLAEFSAQYVTTKNQLIERETDIKSQIIMNHQRLKEAE